MHGLPNFFTHGVHCAHFASGGGGGGGQFQATDNATETQNTTLKTYGKLSLFIFLAFYEHFGSKGAKFVKYFYRSLEWSRVWHYMYGITCRAWHHDASNILDGRPLAALLKFQIDVGRENSASFYRSGWSYFWLTMVTYWSRSASNVYALIGQKLTGEFTLKIYAASGNLFTDSWSWQSFVSSCHVLTFFFHWMYKMKYSGFLDSSIIHGLFIGFFGWGNASAACQSH